MSSRTAISGDAPASPGLARAMTNQVLSVKSAEGSLELYLPSPHVLLGIARGHLTLLMAEQWIAETTPYLANGEVLTGFHDWQHMTSYASEARYTLTKFVMGTGNRQPGHFLVASRIVAMGVAAASLTLALTGVKLASYANRGTFERALVSALPP